MMSYAANHPVAPQGRLRRAFAATWAFLQAMDATSFDDTLDRIAGLEQEVRRLKEELRHIRDPEAGGTHHGDRDPRVIGRPGTAGSHIQSD